MQTVGLPGGSAEDDERASVKFQEIQLFLLLLHLLRLRVNVMEKKKEKVWAYMITSSKDKSKSTRENSQSRATSVWEVESYSNCFGGGKSRAQIL